MLRGLQVGGTVERPTLKPLRHSRDARVRRLPVEWAVSCVRVYLWARVHAWCVLSMSVLTVPVRRCLCVGVGVQVQDLGLPEMLRQEAHAEPRKRG